MFCFINPFESFFFLNNDIFVQILEVFVLLWYEAFADKGKGLGYLEYLWTKLSLTSFQFMFKKQQQIGHAHQSVCLF